MGGRIVGRAKDSRITLEDNQGNEYPEPRKLIFGSGFTLNKNGQKFTLTSQAVNVSADDTGTPSTGSSVGSVSKMIFEDRLKYNVQNGDELKLSSVNPDALEGGNTVNSDPDAIDLKAGNNVSISSTDNSGTAEYTINSTDTNTNTDTHFDLEVNNTDQNDDVGVLDLVPGSRMTLNASAGDDTDETDVEFVSTHLTAKKGGGSIQSDADAIDLVAGTNVTIGTATNGQDAEYTIQATDTDTQVETQITGTTIHLNTSAINFAGNFSATDGGGSQTDVDLAPSISVVKVVLSNLEQTSNSLITVDDSNGNAGEGGLELDTLRPGTGDLIDVPTSGGTSAEGEIASLTGIVAFGRFSVTDASSGTWTRTFNVDEVNSSGWNDGTLSVQLDVSFSASTTMIPIAGSTEGAATWNVTGTNTLEIDHSNTSGGQVSFIIVGWESGMV